MNADLRNRLERIDRATLAPLVRTSLALDPLDILDWSYHPLEGAFGSSYGVYRFRGRAQRGDETLAWSLILKVLGPDTAGRDPAALNYWKREALVYRSDLLDDLPEGLATPRCLNIVEQPDEELWLWLEDVGDVGEAAWSAERYGLAARHLGRFNGAYLVGRSLPEAPWLSTGSLRTWLALAEPGVARLDELSRLPLFDGLAPGDTVARMVRLWAERERLLEALDRLPRTFCHHDAIRRNLAARTLPDGGEETVIFDWAAAGIGVVGAEIAPLFASSLRFQAVDIDRIPEFDRRIFDGYLAGLRDAGWDGDARLVRFAYAAIAALKMGVAALGIKWPAVARRAAALPDGAEPLRLLGPGRDQILALRRYLLDLGDEALSLLPTSPPKRFNIE